MSKIDRKFRVPAISPEDFYNRVADRDSRPVPEHLRESRPFESDAALEVPIERFLSKAWHDREVERLWKRVWQMACREEEIPNSGDVYVYEIATLKYLVVRTPSGEIKAYPNSCRHRGRQLVDRNCRVSQLRCPFHGFTWDLEGRIASIPCAWEFSHIEDPAEWQLPEVKVGVWGGFVFINPNPDAEPLMDFLGDIDRQYEGYPLSDRYIGAHACRVISANWKVAQEAFLEAYHVFGTHPQLLPSGAHTDMKYDVYANYSRSLGVNNLPNAHSNFEGDEQAILDSVLDLRLDQERTAVLGEGVSAREHMATLARESYERVTGESAERFSDSELVDTNAVSVFPNLGPWALFSRLCYRFRPYKDDPDRSYMDVYELRPFNKAEGRPPPAKVCELTEDQDWTQASDLNTYFARVANQDLLNLGAVQEGLKSSATGVVRYSRYQESRIRHFHHLLGTWVGE